MAKTMIPEAKVCRAREPKGAKHIFSVPVHSDIFIYAMLFFVTFVDFTNCIPSYSYVQYFCLLIVALFLCLKFFASKLSHFDLFSLVFLLFCSAVILSSFFSRYDYKTRNPLLASIVFFGGLIEFLFVVKYAKIRGRIDVLLSVIFWLALCVLFINDALLFVAGDGNAIIGDKFHVAYFHIFVIVLTLLSATRRQKMKYAVFQALLFCLVVLSFIVGIRVDCMTGVVGICLMVAWLALCRVVPSFVRSPLTAVVAMLLSVLFMYVALQIMNNAVVQRIVEGTFSHDATLSGRTHIFDVVDHMLKMRPVLGYGYGVSYEVLSGVRFIPDAQNGLAEWLIAGGWCAGVLIIASVFLAFKNSLHETANMKYLDAIRVFIYTYICMATVEITYNAEFFAMVILLSILPETVSDNSSKESVEVV